MEPYRDEVPRINYIHTIGKNMTKDWLKEYAPKTPSDLVVQKPKLDQLNSWLQKASKVVGEVRWHSLFLCFTVSYTRYGRFILRVYFNFLGYNK